MLLFSTYSYVFISNELIFGTRTICVDQCNEYTQQISSISIFIFRDHQDPPVLTESPETATPADPGEEDTEETQDAQEHLVLRESAEMLEQM